MLKFLRRKQPVLAPSPAPIKTRTTPRHTSQTDTPLKDRLQKLDAARGNEMITLLNIGSTQKLSPNELLFKEGTPADRGYFVLDGLIEEFALVDGEKIKVATYPEKAWINFASLDASVERESSARAQEASSVLLIDQRLLNSVDDDVLLFIYRELHQSPLALRANKEKEINAFSTYTQDLIDTLFDIHTKAKDRSKNSQLAQTVIQRIPKLPIATLGLLNKLQDDETSTDEVVELVKSDPSLTSVLLKTLNSAEYHFEEKISNVNHAVSLLGFIGVYQVVMSQSLRKSLPPTKAFQEVYTRSLEISHITFAIAQSSGVGRPAEMATIGLVHDLGSVVIELLRQQNPKLENLIDFFDAAVIGGQLMHAWNLPENIWKAIEYQDFPEFSPADNIPDGPVAAIALIYVARLCHERLHKVSEEQLPTLFLDDYLGLLNWRGLSLDNVLDEKVIPTLHRRGNALPASLAHLIN
ncbi:MAG: HDOD domain-containing protein [Porticoccaceae bacterium]|nr:HDOD domain-containing protein [Porticoccaceae bacterium]